MSLSALSDELSQVLTKKREFLAEIDRIVPCWAQRSWEGSARWKPVQTFPAALRFRRKRRCKCRFTPRPPPV